MRFDKDPTRMSALPSPGNRRGGLGRAKRKIMELKAEDPHPPGMPRAARGLSRSEVERFVEQARQDLTVAMFELTAGSDLEPAMDALRDLSGRVSGLLRGEVK